MSLWNLVCSVHLCYSVRNRTHPLYEIMPMRFAGESFLSQRTFLSLTELTDLTEPFCALFRAHRTPPAYRYHRTFQLKMAVRFCVIGWLNVSVKPCVFCSSVFFCEKKKTLESRCGDFSLTELTDLTELSTSVSNPQNAFGIQISQNVTAIFNTNKGQHEAYIQPIGVSR